MTRNQFAASTVVGEMGVSRRSPLSASEDSRSRRIEPIGTRLALGGGHVRFGPHRQALGLPISAVHTSSIGSHRLDNLDLDLLAVQGMRAAACADYLWCSGAGRTRRPGCAAAIWRIS